MFAPFELKIFTFQKSKLSTQWQLMLNRHVILNEGSELKVWFIDLNNCSFILWENKHPNNREFLKICGNRDKKLNKEIEAVTYIIYL